MPYDERTRAGWMSWMRGVIVCGAAAFCLTAMSWGVGRAVAMVGPVALVVMFTGVAATSPDPAAGCASRMPRWRWWICVGACGVSVVLCLAIAGAASPSLGVLCLAALAATTPPARRRIRHYLASGRPRHPTPAGPASSGTPANPTRPGTPDSETPVDTLAPHLRTLTTTELCGLWRLTFWMLRESTGPVRTLRLVELRHGLIDELEARDPAAVGCWLSAGHHLADGPARYL
jgi:hypothetical protein